MKASIPAKSLKAIADRQHGSSPGRSPAGWSVNSPSISSNTLALGDRRFPESQAQVLLHGRADLSTRSELFTHRASLVRIQDPASPSGEGQNSTSGEFDSAGVAQGDGINSPRRHGASAVLPSTLSSPPAFTRFDPARLLSVGCAITTRCVVDLLQGSIPFNRRRQHRYAGGRRKIGARATGTGVRKDAVHDARSTGYGADGTGSVTVC